jgi:hypothetical protein
MVNVLMKLINIQSYYDCPQIYILRLTLISIKMYEIVIKQIINNGLIPKIIKFITVFRNQN